MQPTSTVGLAPLSLRFSDRDLESRFRLSHAERSRGFTRAAGLLAVGGFALIDVMFRIYDVAHAGLTIVTLAWLFPVILAIFLLTFVCRAELIPALLTIGIIWAAVCMQLVLEALPRINAAVLGYALLAMELLVIHVVARPRFPHTVLLSVVIIAGFIAQYIPIFLEQMPLRSTSSARALPAAIGLAGALAFVFFATGAGLAANYMMERSDRHAFHSKAVADARAEALRLEKARADQLLLNILPEPVAVRLKAGETSIADSQAEATIMFVDIAGFTPYAATLPPEEVVAVLNKIFSEFDRRVSANGLEKIKTIGDAYMVAAGVPLTRHDHAIAVAETALEILSIAESWSDPRMPRLQLRIGINTGPVVAGIIGSSKFAYDVWGDAVNIAARMESHGLVGRIQVAERTRALLEGKYRLEPRGVISVKGKGEMETWFLAGRLSG